MADELPHGKVVVGPLSPLARRMLARARSALDHNDIGAAERALAAARALAPENAEVFRCLGSLAQQRGDAASAADCFRKAADALPEDADLQLALGAALFATGASDEGIGHLRRACELAPDSAPAWLNLGEALKQAASGDAAVAAIARAANLDPGCAAAWLSLARARTSMGDARGAVRAFREMLRLDPASPDAWFGLSNLNTYRFDADEADRLRACFADAGADSEAHELLGFALGKALEDEGDYAGAFDVFRQVNDRRRARLRWDARDAHRQVEEIQRAFVDRGSNDPDASGRGREVIFIASIPRSGSTLVEQILASHPQVEGGDEVQELPDLVDRESRRRGQPFPLWVPSATTADWRRLGAEYLDHTARLRARKPCFTDKNMANWFLAGAALAMLPAARIVLVHRDPLETCIACYRQRLRGDAGFTCDLDDMADYCSDFTRLSRFWLERFPGQVHDLAYERLVREPEACIRDLLAFCELGFDPRCLEFQRTERAIRSSPSAAQVRQPLRRDTARAARYGDRLARVRARLEAAGMRLQGVPTAHEPDPTGA